MNKKEAEIIIIHDGLETRAPDPLIVTLKSRFPLNEIKHFVKSDEGLEYVLNNLEKKLIVLLDIGFSKGEKSGIQVFEEIRAKTSLIYVVLITARTLNELENSDLVSMVNNDALAIQNVFRYPDIVKLVEEALHKLDARVDSVIEDWINRHNVEQRQKPLIKTKEGKVYNMEELLSSIRQQTDIGLDFEKNLLKLAIEIFSRQKIKE